MSALRTFLALCASLALLCAAGHAQLPDPPATPEDALRQMFDQAGIVFTGQVTAVRHINAANGSTGVLEIDFAIDDAIRGTTSNTYTLREWAGISPVAVPQFEIARRYLIFLHPPGPSGLSSPVGGPDGAIPILPGNDAAAPNTPDAAGLAIQATLAEPISASHSPAHTSFRIPGAPSEPASSSTTPLSSATIDLRWIAARVLTPLDYADQPSAPAPTPAHPILAHTNFAPSETSVPTAPLSSNYSDLLTLLRSWETQANAAR